LLQREEESIEKKGSFESPGHLVYTGTSWLVFSCNGGHRLRAEGEGETMPRIGLQEAYFETAQQLWWRELIGLDLSNL